MKDWIISKILAFIGKKLDGYKSKIGGVGLILTGITGLIGLIFPDQGLPKMDFQTSAGFVSAGVGAIGIAHKMQKSITAIHQQTIVTAIAAPNIVTEKYDTSLTPKENVEKIMGDVSGISPVKTGDGVDG
jgi:hypothetical protein